MVTLAAGTFAIQSAHQGVILWRFDMARAPLKTIPRSSRGSTLFKDGTTRWNDDETDPLNEKRASQAASPLGADLVGDWAAYAWWQHKDNEEAGYINAIRFFFQVAGLNAATVSAPGMKTGPFSGTSLLAPYPQELDSPAVVDKSRPGVTMELIRLRRGPRFGFEQVVQRLAMPAVDPANSQVRWFYQNSGEVLAVHDTLGVVAQLTVSADHPLFTIRVAK